MKGKKIVVQVTSSCDHCGKKLLVLTTAEFNKMCNSGLHYTLIGVINPEKQSMKLNKYQKNKLSALVQVNTDYLANKSKDTFIKNFNEAILKNL